MWKKRALQIPSGMANVLTWFLGEALHVGTDSLQVLIVD